MRLVFTANKQLSFRSSVCQIVRGEFSQPVCATIRFLPVFRLVMGSGDDSGRIAL